MRLGDRVSRRQKQLFELFGSKSFQSRYRPHKTIAAQESQMIVTLSERRLSELIRGLEGINDTDSEIAFKMKSYAGRLFKYVYDGYGIKMVGLVEHTGDIGSFSFDISDIGRNYQTGDFDWQKLIGGLQFMNCLAVTVEESDIEQICTGPVCTAMIDG